MGESQVTALIGTEAELGPNLGEADHALAGAASVLRPSWP